MKRIKNIFCFALFGLLFFSCENESFNNTIIDNFDHKAQIKIDQDSLRVYLSSHYLSEGGELMSISDETEQSVTPLIDDTRLDSIEGIVISGVDTTYTMYYLKTVENNLNNPQPSSLDVVFVNYEGMLLDDTVFDSNLTYPLWFSMSSVVKGWSYGLQKFKGGNLVEDSDDDFHFENLEKGYLFFPSGLGYRNASSTLIPSNSPLVFYIELYTVNIVR